MNDKMNGKMNRSDVMKIVELARKLPFLKPSQIWQLLEGLSIKFADCRTEDEAYQTLVVFELEGKEIILTIRIFDLRKGRILLEKNAQDEYRVSIE